MNIRCMKPRFFQNGRYLVDLGGFSLVILAEQSLSLFALLITAEEVDPVDKVTAAV